MRRTNWKLLALVILVGLILCAQADARESRKRIRRSSSAKTAKTAQAVGEAERQVTETQVPAAALAALRELAAGAEITEFAEEIEFGHTFYEGSWKSRSGENMDVLVTQAGDLVEIEEQIDNAGVPAAVRKMARKAAGKNAELFFEKKTMILYEVKFQKKDSRHELLLAPDGRRVEEQVEKKAGKDNPGDDDQGDEEDEDEDDKQVSISNVPKRVKAAILKQAKGGEIEKIEREKEDGKLIYEAEITVGNKEIELKVARNGKLLGKKVEDEEDEDEDDDDHNDDDDR